MQVNDGAINEIRETCKNIEVKLGRLDEKISSMYQHDIAQNGTLKEHCGDIEQIKLNQAVMKTRQILLIGAGAAIGSIIGSLITIILANIIMRALGG